MQLSQSPATGPSHHHTPEAHRAPSPAMLMHLRPTNAAGLLVGAGALTATGVALALGAQEHPALWLTGQLLLAFSLVQWFAILHECGHETLFRTRALHTPLGHLAGFLCVIPFRIWRRVHGRHHKWTGWQDIDPTTQSLVPRPLGTAERVLVNVCWRWWIPLFSVLYRVNNFWHMPRLLRMFPAEADRRAFVLNAITIAVIWAVIIALVGPLELLRIAGVGIVLSLMAEDLLLLSQHTHIPQHVSGGADVRPYPTLEQEVFTRSLRFPPWLSAALLRIDAHELHHMYPFVPGYRLAGVKYEPENEIDWLTWLRGAKRLSGEVFLFQNRYESGADI